MIRRLSKRGEVVIPKVLRDRYDIRPGDEVVYEVRGDWIIIRKANPGGERAHVSRSQAP